MLHTDMSVFAAGLC